MKKLQRFLFPLIIVLLSSHAPFVRAEETKLSKDIQWFRKSPEYTAVCVQTYAAATKAVKELALKQKKNWVVVLDADETVIDNSQYQVELGTRSFSHETWDAWTKRKEAGAIPGAKEFLDSVRALGKKAHIAFITNRSVPQEADTIENMKALGLFKDGDIIMGRAIVEGKPDSTDTKEVRRSYLTKGEGRGGAHGPLNIIALVGDQITDFMEVKTDGMTRTRQEISSDPRWGKEFFMLPNPMYGGWVSIP